MPEKARFTVPALGVPARLSVAVDLRAVLKSSLRTPPFATVTGVLLAMPLALLISSVPPLMVVGPV